MSSPAPTTPASSPSTSIAPETQRQRSPLLLHAADAAETIAPGLVFAHLQRAFELWDDVEPARRTNIAPTGCGRQPTWRAGRSATNEQQISRQAAFEVGPPPQGEAFGHERLGRFLWASGRLEEGRAQFEQAASMLSENNDPAAAPVYAGLAQAELLADHYAEAERWCTRVFDLVATPDAGRAEWVTARRVLGVLRSQLGDPEGGVALCQESFAEAPNAQARALASLYLCTVLLDAARNREAINAAVDAVAEGHLSGLDHSYGGYLDALGSQGTHGPGSLVRMLRVTRIDVGLAMLVAGAVNLSMVLIAATNLQGRDNTDSIEGAHAAVRDTLGPTVALFFAIGLLASGLASTSVGAYAGAMIMQGLLRRSYPLLVRRLVTLIPALVILAIGVDPSRALVISQVVLSFGIPFALVPLVRLTSDRAVMGDDTNHRVTTALGWGVAALISLLNVVLIYLTVSS